MDIRMPRMDGLEATRRIIAAPSPPRVLMLTTFDLDEYAFDALVAGGSGFLLKDVAPEQLLAGIRIIVQARGLSNSEIADQLVVSSTTIKTHVARVLMKLGLHDRTRRSCSRTRTGSSDRARSGSPPPHPAPRAAWP